MLQAAERQREIFQCQIVSSEVQKRMQHVQSAASKAGRSFSAPLPPAAPAAPGSMPFYAPPPSQTAMAHAHCHAISRAGSEVSPMMRLAFKSATPMREALSAASPQLSIADNDEEDEAGNEEAMHQMEQFVQQQQIAIVSASAGGLSPAAVPDESPEEQRDFASLLEQLRSEPSQPEESEAKFTIFTAYLNTVEELRSQALALWETVRQQGVFPASVLAGLQRSVASIDGQDRMGANEMQGVWIVYGMMQQAHSNYTFIYNAVRDINTKLTLVTETPDCPICTSPMGGTSGREEKILQCCHKVCKECWDLWTEVRANAGQAPMCPVCRNQEFLVAIASAVALPH